MRYELYKLFRKKTVLILLTVGLIWLIAAPIVSAMQYSTVTEDMKPLKGFEAIRYDRELQNIYSGRIPLEELEKLWNEAEAIRAEVEAGNENAYWQQFNRYRVIVSVGARTYYLPMYVQDARESGDLSELYAGTIEKLPGEHGLVPAADPESPIVKKVLAAYDHIDYPLYGAYMGGWEDFFNTIPFFFQYVVGLLIVIGVVPLFADETSTGTAAILLTTRYGKSRMLVNKVLAAMLYAVVLFSIFAIVAIVTQLCIYGTSSLPASIQLINRKSPYNLSIGGALGLWLLFGLLASVAAAATTMLFSAVANNAFTAFIPAVLAYILPSFSYSGLSPLIHRCMKLLPSAVIGNIDTLFGAADYYNIFGLLVERKILIIVCSVVFAVLFSCLSVWLYRRREPQR